MFCGERLGKDRQEFMVCHCLGPSVSSQLSNKLSCHKQRGRAEVGAGAEGQCTSRGRAPHLSWACAMASMSMRRGILITIVAILAHPKPTLGLLNIIASALPSPLMPAPLVANPSVVLVDSSTRTLAPTISPLVESIPSIKLSSTTKTDSLYAPRDAKKIPSGFVRICAKIGGYAPGPLWESTTNGLTPWFENKGDGTYIYYNAYESKWFLENSSGAGLYLAPPDDSLLLPPTRGWVSVQGQREGAPRISFI